MQHLTHLKLKGLIIAGSASLKHELVLDPPLQSLILKTVDVEYGGEQGFHQAIDLVSDVLKNVPLVREKQLISTFMDEIAKDTNRYAFGVKATMQVLEMGVVEKIIVWDDLPLIRFRIMDSDKKEQVVIQNTMAASKDVQILESVPLLEWLMDVCPQHGAEVHIVRNLSPEGSQFCAGFGGLGALLRYPVDPSTLDGDAEDFADDYDDSDGESEAI